ncbi:MAG: phosphotransferase family protein [Caulobacteraceae bacterium]
MNEPGETVAPALSLLDERLAVEAIVAKAVGCELIHVESREIFRANPLHRPRRFVRHSFRRNGGAGEAVEVFTKAGARLSLFYENLQNYLSGLDIPEFRVPTYYGLIRLETGAANSILGVWGYVARDTSRRFGQQWRENRDSVVRAAAAMTALSDDVQRAAPNISRDVEFLRPLARVADETVANYARRGLDISALAPAAKRLAAVEPIALERLESLGGYFTHNDYRAANVFLNPGEKPVILDWDSASLGPPGATLRSLARLPRSDQKQVVDLYCAHLEAQDFHFRWRDVLFTMRATEIFHALIHAARFSAADDSVAESIFRWGLEHVEDLA